MDRTCIGGGMWFDRDTAIVYAEAQRWNGNNHISCATGSQWDHEELIRTASGVWILRAWSQWQGSVPSYRVVEAEEAYRWLVDNEHEDVVPDAALAATEV